MPKFAVEVLKPMISVGASGAPRAGRRGKLTKPVFITPSGVIDEFPTKDEDYFSSPPRTSPIPESHPLIQPGSGWAIINRSDLERSARYLRWLDGKQTDTRMSIEDSYAIFANEGRDGLKKLFSKTHVFYLLREFKKRGWAIE